MRGACKRAALGAVGGALGTVRAGGRPIVAEVVRMLRREHADMAILLDLLERLPLAGAAKWVPLLPTPAILFSIFNNLSGYRLEFG